MFVARKPDGTIYGAWTMPQTEQQRIDGEDNSPDWVADEDAELVAFLTPASVASDNTEAEAAAARERRKNDALDLLGKATTLDQLKKATMAYLKEQ
jgi:hypothetical protein